MMASSHGDMSPNTARRLAALILAGAEQLEEKAQQDGVTAYVGQAVQREKPNERFLQSTLRNVASSNRRADERVMWAAWEARKQLQESSIRATAASADNGRCSSRDGRNGRGSRKRKRSRSSSRERDAAGNISRRSTSSSRQRSKPHRKPEHGRSTKADASNAGPSGGNYGDSCSSSHNDSSAEEKSSESSSTDSSERKATAAPAALSNQPGPPAAGDYAANGDDNGDDDRQLLQWLGASQKVRGRGAVGPSADMPGPYLEAPSGVSPTELQQLDRGTAKGPERPSWMQRDDAERRRLRPDAGFLQGLLRAQGVLPAEGSGRGVGQGAEPGPEARQGTTPRGRSRSSGEGSSGNGSSQGRVRRKRSKSKKRKHKHKRSSKHKKKHKRRDSS